MTNTQHRISEAVNRQQSFFRTNQTKDISNRLNQLDKLKEAIIQYEDKLIDALSKDLGKHPLESYATEIGFVLKSIREVKRKIPKWAKIKRVGTPLMLFPSKSKIYYEPFGTVLIIGPFNYPVQLLLEPLIGAISAGNTVVLKPSEMTPHVSAVIKEMIERYFDPELITVIEGGVDTNIKLLEQPFDYIFFTGSSEVGKKVMTAAAKRLTPVTLELGGKSPAIVTEDANLTLAARRIMYGKTLNAGQTCIAPDYIVVHHTVREAFIKECHRIVHSFYGEVIQESTSYPRIVNEKHWKRLNVIINESADEMLFGGKSDLEDKYIEPTLLASNWESPSMQDELFGPILPIIEYESLDDAIEKIKDRPKPLALYIFSQNQKAIDKVLNETSSGGVSVNNTIFHIASTNLPFGGVGKSGIGKYHGKYSFETFSNQKAVLVSSRLDTPFVLPPYTTKHLKYIKMLMK